MRKQSVKLLDAIKIGIVTLGVIALSGSSVYQPLSNIKKVEYSGIISVENYNINLTVYDGVYNHTYENIPERVVSNSEHILSFIKSKDLPQKECNPVYNLDIYLVTMSVLNDRDIFNRWKGSVDPTIIAWALYDERPDSKAHAAIVLTEHGTENNKILLAHELAHYWHHRFCLEKYSVDTEQFAMEFERYLYK